MKFSTLDVLNAFRLVKFSIYNGFIRTKPCYKLICMGLQLIPPFPFSLAFYLSQKLCAGGSLAFY